MIGEALRQLLIDADEVAAIVGNRVSLDRSSLTTFDPSIVLWAESEEAYDALDGPLGMDRPRIRVACYAGTRPTASDLRQRVRAALGGFSGVVSGVFIKAIAQVPGNGESFGTDRVSIGSDRYRYVSVCDFYVFYDWAKV